MNNSCRTSPRVEEGGKVGVVALIWGGFRGCKRIMIIEVTGRFGWKERRKEIVCLGR